MEDFNLSDTKKNLFAKAFARKDKGKDRDLITSLYEKSGEAFRGSPVGKLVKNVVTSDFTKTKRDQVLDKFGAPEHYKRFAQYLTGGTVGNKDITNLPENVKKDVVRSHFMGTEKDPDAHLVPYLGYPEKEKKIIGGKHKGKPNPSYNPDSTLLSTYNNPARTAYSLGHVQFKPKDDGGFTLTDTYDVDSNVSMGAKPYKPLRGTRTDLTEGGQLASRLYDLSKFLGINQPMKYNVDFEAQRFK